MRMLTSTIESGARSEPMRVNCSPGSIASSVTKTNDCAPKWPAVVPAETHNRTRVAAMICPTLRISARR